MTVRLHVPGLKIEPARHCLLHETGGTGTGSACLLRVCCEFAASLAPADATAMLWRQCLLINQNCLCHCDSVRARPT